MKLKDGVMIINDPIPILPPDSTFLYHWSTTYRWNPNDLSNQYGDDVFNLCEFLGDGLLLESLVNLPM